MEKLASRIKCVVAVVRGSGWDAHERLCKPWQKAVDILCLEGDHICVIQDSPVPWLSYGLPNPGRVLFQLC